ncbi:MAG TPA: redoxin domain-containing protein [Chthoniobacterales bacterium]|nr:redoxin domain-containing protein [Chthoniobacterales bacterium]
MEQLSQPPCWKLRIGALFSGALAFCVILGIALYLSNDLRLIYVVELILLFCMAMWFGQKKRDWIAAALLVLPSVAGFSFFTLNVPALWLNDVLWAAAVVVGIVSIDLARRQRGLAIGLIAALLIVSGWYCLAYAPKQLALHNSRIQNVSAPIFNLQAVSSGFDPSGSGKIVVLDFFSTTCVPCIAELPHLMAARRDLSNRSDVQFVLVASDKGDDTPEKFRAFAERKHLGVPLAFDPEGKAHDSFGATGVPAIVIIDKTGRVRFTHEGFNPAEANFRRDLVQFIRNLD